jgi:hypothetical protein
MTALEAQTLSGRLIEDFAFGDLRSMLGHDRDERSNAASTFRAVFDADRKTYRSRIAAFREWRGPQYRQY